MDICDEMIMFQLGPHSLVAYCNDFPGRTEEILEKFLRETINSVRNLVEMSLQSTTYQDSLDVSPVDRLLNILEPLHREPC